MTLTFEHDRDIVKFEVPCKILSHVIQKLLSAQSYTKTYKHTPGAVLAPKLWGRAPTAEMELHRI